MSSQSSVPTPIPHPMFALEFHTRICSPAGQQGTAHHGRTPAPPSQNSCCQPLLSHSFFVTEKPECCSRLRVKVRAVLTLDSGHPRRGKVRAVASGKGHNGGGAEPSLCLILPVLLPIQGQLLPHLCPQRCVTTICSWTLAQCLDVMILKAFSILNK